MQFLAFARPDGAGGYGVDFPDAPGCVTHGRDLAEAEAMAAEALAGWLEVSLDYGDPLQLPSAHHRTPKGATRLVVPVPPELVIRLTLRAGRTARGFSQAQLATHLGMTAQAVQKLERAGANPTVATLARVSAVLGVPFIIGEAGDTPVRVVAKSTGKQRADAFRRSVRDGKLMGGKKTKAKDGPFGRRKLGRDR